MRGHEQLIGLRRAGFVPSVVFIDIGPDKLRMASDWSDLTPHIAYLSIGDGEKPSRADLRCLVGLTVSVQGDDEQTVHAVRDACIEAKAKRVIATVTKCTCATPAYEQFKTTEMTDTGGFFVWPN